MDTHNLNKKAAKHGITPEQYIFLRRSNRKIRYFACDLKREKVIIDGEKVIFTPSREDSLDRLADEGVMFATGEKSVEDIVMEALLFQELYRALDQLNTGERCLIEEIFFSCDGEEKSERDVAKTLGLPQKTVNNRKRCALAKLKKIMDKQK